MLTVLRMQVTLTAVQSEFNKSKYFHLIPTLTMWNAFRIKVLSQFFGKG
jgi:hypothetical protein